MPKYYRFFTKGLEVEKNAYMLWIMITSFLKMGTFILLSFISIVASAQDNIRIATYNIKFLKDDISQERVANIMKVIGELDSDIIALQEIDDRLALENVFSPDKWHIIIDDDSGENQDLALVVRKNIKVKGFDSPLLNANDSHFLFPGSKNNSGFPDRRDLLCIELELSNHFSFFIMVHHAKSRYGGRASNNDRRVLASQKIIKRLEREYDDDFFVLLGDFNDNPDDASLNILETGNPNYPAVMEDNTGLFLVNLTEELCVEGHVSHGRNTWDLIGPERTFINTIDVDSRQRNFDNLNKDINTGDILFDQILVSHKMYEKYVLGSVAVFDEASGVIGNSKTRASDHLPVFAEFSIGEVEVPPNIRITSLLPNPVGSDSNNEIIKIKNFSDNNIDLTGYWFEDTADNILPLSGLLSSDTEKTIQLSGMQMPLNNSGDKICLYDDSGHLIHCVSYSKGQVVEGIEIQFNN